MSAKTERGLTTLVHPDGVFRTYKHHADRIGKWFRDFTRHAFNEIAKEKAVRMHYLRYHGEAPLNVFRDNLLKEKWEGTANILRNNYARIMTALEPLGINVQEKRGVISGLRSSDQAVVDKVNKYVIAQHMEQNPLLEVTLSSSDNYNGDAFYPAKAPLITEQETNEQVTDFALQAETPLIEEPNIIEIDGEPTPLQLLAQDSEHEEPFISIDKDPRAYAVAVLFLKRMFLGLENDIEKNQTRGHVIIEGTEHYLDGVRLYQLGGYDLDDITEGELGMSMDFMEDALYIDPENLNDPRAKTAQELIRALFKLPENFPLIPTKNELGKVLRPGIKIEMSHRDEWDIYTITYEKNPGLELQINFLSGEEKAESVFIAHNQY